MSVNGILQVIIDRIYASRDLDEETCVIINTFFGDMGLAAMQLIDHNRIIKIISSLQRVYYMAKASSGTEFYHIFAATYTCTCPSYLHNVIEKSESPLCKHALAVIIAEALGESHYQIRHVSEDEYAQDIYDQLCNTSISVLL